MRSFGWPGLRTIRWWRQDKGHFAGAQAFVDVIRAGGGASIPVDEVIDVSRGRIEVGKVTPERSTERYPLGACSSLRGIRRT